MGEYKTSSDREAREKIEDYETPSNREMREKMRQGEVTGDRERREKMVASHRARREGDECGVWDKCTFFLGFPFFASIHFLIVNSGG